MDWPLDEEQTLRLRCGRRYDAQRARIVPAADCNADLYPIEPFEPSYPIAPFASVPDAAGHRHFLARFLPSPFHPSFSEILRIGLQPLQVRPDGRHQDQPSFPHLD